MAPQESFRANTVDAASAYVAISRAQEHASVDRRAKLANALGLRNGAQVGAIDEALTRHGPGTVLDDPDPDPDAEIR